LKKILTNVPNGWDTTLIPEVLFFQEGPGVRKWQFKTDGIKLLNVGNINNQRINLDTTKIYLSEEEANGKYSHFLVDDGDLLIACSGIVVDNFPNKIAFAMEKHLPLCLNTSTMRFKSLDANALNLIYFKYYLQTKYFNKQLRRLITGSAQLNFGPSHIKQIELLLPPLEEQKQIAAILDAADELRQKDKALIAKYDDLTQSLFLDMFGDPVTNPMGWEENMLGECVDQITYGLTVRPEYIENGVCLISAREIRSGEIDFVNAPRISDADFRDLTEKGKPKFEDILFSKTGSIGHCAIVRESKAFAITQNAARLSFNNSVNVTFAINYLRSPYIQSFARQRAKGNAVKDLQLGDMKKFIFFTPPYSLQTQFANRVQNIEAQKTIAQESLNKSDDLFNSLLQKAFIGELTN
jgi:type I restriction enzyme, S subunit